MKAAIWMTTKTTSLASAFWGFDCMNPIHRQ